jgi:hypothetical protein
MATPVQLAEEKGKQQATERQREIALQNARAAEARLRAQASAQNTPLPVSVAPSHSDPTYGGVNTNIARSLGGAEAGAGGYSGGIPGSSPTGRSDLPGPLGSISNFLGDAGNTLEATFIGEERELTCPNCDGKILSKTSGRLFFYITQFLQRFSDIVIPTSLLTYLKERMPVAKTTALKKCGACDNKRTLKDPSDDRSRYAAAAGIAQSLAPKIADAEARMGPPGGDQYIVMSGSTTIQCGLVQNPAPSYRVDEGMGIRNKGLATSAAAKGEGRGQADENYSHIVPEGAYANHVQGLNPPAVPGGFLNIVCGNGLKVDAASHGIDLATSGPVNIGGGITSITGPEVSVGTQTGRLLLGGETINMEAKSIEVAPTDGHFFVKGTISNTGNMMCGGHAHMESASVVQLETTGKNETSKASSGGSIYGGPAFWGGLGVEGIVAALRELLAFTTLNTFHPKLFAEVGPASFRYPQSMLDNVLNVAYMTRPIELIPTGICVGLFGVGLVYNFPHCHAQPDQPHTHGMRVPNIKCDADKASQLRKANAATSAPAPVQKYTVGILDAIVGLWTAISSVFIATGKAIFENNYIK